MDVKDSAKHRSAFATIGAQTAQAVVWVSGLFSLVLCVIVIVNHIQVETADPLDDKMMVALKTAIGKDPADRETRETFRKLHLMARRAFFTNQVQMRTGGLLLLGSVAIFLAAMKTLVELKRVNPVPTGAMPMEGGNAERAAARWAVAAGGGVLVLVTLFVVYVSPPEIYLEPTGAAAAAAETPPGPAPKPTPAPAVAAPQPPIWPSFRGPLGTGEAPCKDVPLAWDGKAGTGVRWKKPIPRIGKGCPVVWGGRVFVSGSDGKSHEVYAYDAESGESAWTATLSSTAPKPAEPVDDVGHASPSLATDGERLYAVFGSGDVAAFGYDGKQVWSRSVGQPETSYGYASSPAVHAGRLLLQIDDKKSARFLALDGKSGQPAWEQKREGTEAYASPMVADVGGKRQAILVGNPWVIAYDPSSGKPLWSTKCMKNEIGPSAAVCGTTVYVVTDHHRLFALDAGADGKVLWEGPDEDLPDASTPVATPTHVFMFTSGSVINCIDAKTGKKAWSQETDDGFYGSPILAAGRIYAMSRDGVTHVLKASGEKYESLAKNPLGEKADCTPAFAEGRIFLRSDKNLYCVGK